MRVIAEGLDLSKGFPEMIRVELYPNTHRWVTYERFYEHEGGGCYYNAIDDDDVITSTYISLYPDGHLTYLWNGKESPLNYPWEEVSMCEDSYKRRGNIMRRRITESIDDYKVVSIKMDVVIPKKANAYAIGIHCENAINKTLKGLCRVSAVNADDDITDIYEKDYPDEMYID